ncbi:hypothetical protein [Nonomuraea insulae]|uniref:Reverse transcriptase domain-containing protein n=1 Tax=Nonomuraea insulae TaxID=1616787 RepID=A0ABW1D1V6_9ACTN
MDSLPQTLIKSLKIFEAVELELQAVRNLIPPEPWTEALASKKKEVTAWISSMLSSNYRPTGSVLTNAKKASHGIRPVPTLGLAERVVYRSLVEYILREHRVGSRTQKDYRDFVIAPIVFAHARSKENKRLEEAQLPTLRNIRYIVESDITAFYQYIDHEVLRRELELQTGKTEAVAYLIQFLAELEGKAYGLPQLLGPSDDLSEVHIGIMERDLVRQGLYLWRFNDDFRVACESYSDALGAIEMLAESARAIGLVIADHKTLTPSVRTYVRRALRSEPDTLNADVDLDTAQIELSDYLDPGGEKTIEEASTAIRRIALDPSDPQSINLKDIKRDETTILRNALASLTRFSSDVGLAYMQRLFSFVPSLTPEIAHYLIAMHEGHGEKVEQLWDKLSQRASSEWQSLWLIYVSRYLGITGGSSSRIDWIRKQKNKGQGRLIHGEAEIALAMISETSFAELDRALRMESQALAPWYVLAVKQLTKGETAPTDKQIEAVKNSSRLYRWLLGD